MRACVYFSNPHPFYMFLVMNSIKMLRNHNQSIPIYLYFIDTPPDIFNSEGLNSADGYDFNKYDKGEEFFTNFCNLFNVKVVCKPWKKDNLEYFPINKIYLCECEAESVVFLDADTFIFKDIEELFDANQKNDFIACNNPMPQDWRSDFLGTDLGTDLGTFNSGVMLFNNSVHKRIGPLWINQCEETWHGDTELSNWIKNGNKWRTEEVSLSKVILDNDIDFSYFPSSQVFLPKVKDDLKLYSTIVYHSFTQNWMKVYNLCQGISPRKIKFKNRLFKK